MMPDREKVVNALANCVTVFGMRDCSECPYKDSDDCENKLMFDALALLKEQEAIVRCKDCKYFDSYRCTNDMVLQRIDDCGCHPSFNVDREWFCADGERVNNDA